METTTAVQFPKVAIRFCVQCKWNLRAAYYAQELLQTFSNTIGEISLIPVTGGTFTIHLYTQSQSGDTSEAQLAGNSVTEHLVWDRKRDTGFPETKELKGRVRALIDPEKDMGHIDRALKKGKGEEANQSTTSTETSTAEKGPEIVPVQSADLGGSVGVVGTEIAGTVRSAPSHGHEGHTVSLGTISDCAECMAAAKEDEVQAERGNPLG